MKKKTILLFLVIALTFISVSAMFGCKTNAEADTFRLIVPENWELEVGDSRTIDYAFRQGVTNRQLTFEVSNKKRASVDEWGRVTALQKGKVRITAKTVDGDKASVQLNVVEKSEAKNINLRTIHFTGEAVQFGSSLQKLVTRYPIGDDQIPAEIASISNYTEYQTATTKDGAVWTITNYGVLRIDDNAQNSRDVEQRFMGDRYFYTNADKPLAIVADGDNGIWTIVPEGVTHINMVDIDGIEKADLLYEQTKAFVERRGMVSNSYYIGGNDGDREDGDNWKPTESDNDGLWTSMYGAGELMRYAYLKESGASAAEIEEARKSATRATEAVLLLSNLSMRTGTVEAYIRYQPNALFDNKEPDAEFYPQVNPRGKYYSETALVKGGDYSLNIPYVSPAEAFEIAYEEFIKTGNRIFVMNKDYMTPFQAEDWLDPRLNEDVEFAKRTRLLEGYWTRTYSLPEENNRPTGFIHWDHKGDGTAVGVSEKPYREDELGYYINGENQRGLVVDASRPIPQRLWDNLIGSDYTLEDIIYKGDTSSDEMIGHLFIYKLAFDILGPEDPEIKEIIANTMDSIAQHLTDNSYMMVDGAGQPGTWSKFNREFFYNGSQLGGSALTSSVVLSLFKLAHYTTGYEKWHNEYMMAALDPSYEYARLMTQYTKQGHLLLKITLEEIAGGAAEELGIPSTIVDNLLKELDVEYGSVEADLLMRFFLNYSDEEMAMLAFYLLFQMEEDETLLGYYRDAIDEWWKSSIQYSENPLWYYIYQLAYPNKTVTDYYGNNVLETAAWSLSRHPNDLTKYSASNNKRDDMAEFTLNAITTDSATLSYDISGGKERLEVNGPLDLLKAIKDGPKLTWKVAAPDERDFHKYNNSSYDLHTVRGTGRRHHSPNSREGSTTYTLPFWMGLYHGMLEL